jgi:hypothetical protein
MSYTPGPYTGEYRTEEASLGEECAFCCGPFVVGNDILMAPDGDLLHLSCQEDYEQEYAERQYEDFLERYYGD